MGLVKNIQRLKSTRRQMLCAAALAPLFVAAHMGAHWLRFGLPLGGTEGTNFAATIAVVVLVKLVVFGSFRVFQGWSRYVTFHDLVTLGKAATVSSLVLVLSDYLFSPGVSAPRSVFLLDWCLTLIGVGGLRSLSRLIQERQPLPFMTSDKAPVFIVGTSNAGEALLRAIRLNSKLPYRVVGFVTSQRAALGTHIGGVPVVGMIEQTCELAEQYGVPEVLITAGELSGKQVRELVEDGRQRRVAVKVLPSYEQLLHGSVDLRPRTVSIEDLLRRDPVKLNLEELHDWIDGRVLLVTGSAGSIGSEICRQLLQFSPRRLVVMDRSENGQFFLERELRELSPDADIEVCIADINDALRMNGVFRKYQPDIVFHAAAYKHVPLMEANPGEAVKNICLATRMLADLAHQHQVSSFVMISTDKAVNPTSVMGCCKRVAELYVQALARKSRCRFVTVRFGNVLDSAGSVVPIFREQIARGGPVTVTHPDMTRYFMTIPEASQLVIQAGAMGEGGEIFVLDMGEPVKILDLATDMIRLSGLQLGKDIEFEFSGVRPGEKLYEELHLEGEQHLPTSHSKIRVNQCKQRELHSVIQDLAVLMKVADRSDEEIRDELRRIVPQFVSPEFSADERSRRRAA
jgi:FlaA1/EpsC-like NDP-sugar epimerase